MTRLPSVDRTTQQSELAVFASLGLAGVVMVALALIQTTKYVAGSDRIAAALASPPTVFTTALPSDPAKPGVTNAATPAGERASAPAVAPDKV